MASSFLIAVGLFAARRGGLEMSSHVALVLSVAATTLVWVLVTFMTPPADVETLRRFYRLVRPAGRGWRRVVGAGAEVGPRDKVALAFAGWVLGCTFVYSALFGVGALLYRHTAQGTLCLVVAVVSAIGLAWVVPRVWRDGESAEQP
jgi:hypothetical protein